MIIKFAAARGLPKTKALTGSFLFIFRCLFGHFTQNHETVKLDSIIQGTKVEASAKLNYVELRVATHKHRRRQYQASVFNILVSKKGGQSSPLFGLGCTIDSPYTSTSPFTLLQYITGSAPRIELLI